MHSLKSTTYVIQLSKLNLNRSSTCLLCHKSFKSTEKFNATLLEFFLFRIADIFQDGIKELVLYSCFIIANNDHVLDKFNFCYI